MIDKARNKKAFARVISLIFIVVLLISAIPCTVFAGESKELITSFTDLKTAIRAAKDGDTLYVGDINFTPSGNIFNSLGRYNSPVL